MVYKYRDNILFPNIFWLNNNNFFPWVNIREEWVGVSGSGAICCGFPVLF